MANEVKVPNLTAALQAIGNAHVYVGSFFAANLVTQLGQKEGQIQVQHDMVFNQLTAPEITGPMVHDETLDGENLVLTVPLVVPADGSLWADTSPTGASGGGYSFPQVPTDTSAVIIPDKEVGGGLRYDSVTPEWVRLAGNGVAAANGTDATPKNALWLWRVRISRGAAVFDRANGGKMIVPVTIQAKYQAESTSGNAMPEGHHLYTWGDPVAAGVVGFAFGAPV
jgi:hypothetical protein